MSAAAAATTGCRRCGACCRRGGPALHGEDRLRVESGALPLADLFTIRPGEPVADPVAGLVIAAPTDIIKVKGRGGSWVCRFWDGRRRGCRIYAARPYECRLLACWDSEPFARRYAVGRLTRRDLLSAVAGLWDLVAEHERRCSIDRAAVLLARGAPAGAAGRELAGMLAYDAEIRRLTAARGGIDPERVEFLFGRPLRRVIPQLRRFLAQGRAAGGR